ncbi:MAG: hypothetical protein ABMB14_30090 [Myxococcota bacterium]
MNRLILLPALLLSGIAFAQSAPAPTPTPSMPSSPSTTTPSTTAPGTKAPVAKAVFEDVDMNKDGSLDKTELSKMADLLRDFNMIDTDKNSKLSKNEYQVWIDKQKSTTPM